MITKYSLKVFNQILLALLYCFAALVFSASAHSLPGSELVFENNDTKIELSLSFPLRELVIAEPHLNFIENTSNLFDLTTREKRRLSDYFSKHIKVKPASYNLKDPFLSPSLHTLVIEEAFNEHVGSYKQIKAQITLNTEQTLSAKFFPVALRYDAILHEIRSHKVVVFYKNKQNQNIKLTDFIYSEVDGVPSVHMLSLPQ